MYDSRIQYAMKNFIRDDYFLPMQKQYELKETAESGKSCLKVIIDGTNICVEKYDNQKRCAFLREEKSFGMQKCIDHFILKKEKDVWNLYMIEMKSSVGNRTWCDIKSKMRSSYLNIRALCEFLGIILGNVYSYTTYEKEAFETLKDTADVKTHVPILGRRATSFKDDEWDKGIIKVEIDKILEFSHTAVKMERNTENNILVGDLRI
ncbi:MAG: hypothetical protein PHD60_11220 [Clostridia bacterium]|nr:hypothetical protein [Clostridia bacterium]